MKQTAVEWLIDELSITNFLWLSDKPEMKELIKIIKQAKEMEKQQKYTEEDMLNCWNTLMVAMTNHNPIFFKDYINSLNKQD